MFQKKHNLGLLLEKLGKEERVVLEILKSVEGKLPASGLFKDIPVDVCGLTVHVRGMVVNGIPRLATIFIK